MRFPLPKLPPHPKNYTLTKFDRIHYLYKTMKDAFVRRPWTITIMVASITGLIIHILP